MAFAAGVYDVHQFNGPAFQTQAGLSEDPDELVLP